MLKFPLCCSELSLEPKILAFESQLVSGRRDTIKVSAGKIGNFSLGSVYINRYSKVVRLVEPKEQLNVPVAREQVKIRRTEICLRGGNVLIVKDLV